MTMTQRNTIEGWDHMEKGITKLIDILEEQPEASQLTPEDYVTLYSVR
ncbi:hypothetical protein CASFOL_025091 [Castilleja foliolosa]|uniref:Uncharacterized protein n=1 Tax=Castilleja foliolosa TaxID=1961234 RepID=A0ABD3CRL9_9LAMI